MIDTANLIVSSITAIAATYLAVVALKQSARPNILVCWQRGSDLPLRPKSGFDDVFIFDVLNVGHWYAQPPAHDIFFELECPGFFGEMELVSGGRFGKIEAEGSGRISGPKITLRAHPFTLHAGEMAKFALEVKWSPHLGGGNGAILARLRSADGAAFFKEFKFELE